MCSRRLSNSGGRPLKLTVGGIRERRWSRRGRGKRVCTRGSNRGPARGPSTSPFQDVWCLRFLCEPKRHWGCRRMRRRFVSALILTFGLLSACATTVLAPGADKVRMASNPSDVATCKATGNINIPQNAGLNADNIVRNQTVGFGGNTAFVTPGSSIAYLCP